MNSKRSAHQQADQHEAHSVGGLSLYSRRRITTPTPSSCFHPSTALWGNPRTFQSAVRWWSSEASTSQRDLYRLWLINQSDGMKCYSEASSSVRVTSAESLTTSLVTLQWTQAFILKSILTRILILNDQSLISKSILIIKIGRYFWMTKWIRIITSSLLFHRKSFRCADVK